MKEISLFVLIATFCICVYNYADFGNGECFLQPKETVQSAVYGNIDAKGLKSMIDSKVGFTLLDARGNNWKDNNIIPGAKMASHEFATEELQGFYDRGNSFSELNQKGRSEILEVFSDNFDWQFHLNKAAADFHSFDSLKRYCAHLTRTEKKIPDELKHWLADVLEGI